MLITWFPLGICQPGATAYEPQHTRGREKRGIGKKRRAKGLRTRALQDYVDRTISQILGVHELQTLQTQTVADGSQVIVVEMVVDPQVKFLYRGSRLHQ